MEISPLTVEMTGERWILVLSGWGRFYKKLNGQCMGCPFVDVVMGRFVNRPYSKASVDDVWGDSAVVSVQKNL